MQWEFKCVKKMRSITYLYIDQLASLLLFFKKNIIVKTILYIFIKNCPKVPHLKWHDQPISHKMFDQSNTQHPYFVLLPVDQYQYLVWLDAPISRFEKHNSQKKCVKCVVLTQPVGRLNSNLQLHI